MGYSQKYKKISFFINSLMNEKEAKTEGVERKVERRL